MFGTKFSKEVQNKNAAWYCSINYSDWQKRKCKINCSDWQKNNVNQLCAQGYVLNTPYKVIGDGEKVSRRQRAPVDAGHLTWNGPWTNFCRCCNGQCRMMSRFQNESGIHFRRHLPCRSTVTFSLPKMARKLPPLYTTSQKLSTRPSQANPTQPNPEILRS